MGLTIFIVLSNVIERLALIILIFFDLCFQQDANNLTTIHGKYEGVKNKKHTIEYITKNVKKFKDKQVFLADNINSVLFDDNKGFVNFYSRMLELAKDGRIEDALTLLSYFKPLDFLQNHDK